MLVQVECAVSVTRKQTFLDFIQTNVVNAEKSIGWRARLLVRLLKLFLIPNDTTIGKKKSKNCSAHRVFNLDYVEIIDVRTEVDRKWL